MVGLVKFAPLALDPIAEPPDATVNQSIVFPDEVAFNKVVPVAQREAGVAVAGVGAAGVALIVKVPALTAVPLPVTTEIVPVAVAAGIAVIDVELTTVYEKAFTPPNLTALTPTKFVPVIVTTVEFAQPLAGVNEVMVGPTIAGGVHVNVKPFTGLTEELIVQVDAPTEPEAAVADQLVVVALP